MRVADDEVSLITIKWHHIREQQMALVQSLAISFNSKPTLFLRTFAGVSGGAVYATGNVIGTVFRSVTFVGN